MVSEKGKGKNNWQMPATYAENRRKVIGKIMARGGIVRRVLENHEINVDSTSWRGRSGIEIADDLLTVVESIGGLPVQTRDRIAILSNKFIAVNTYPRMSQLDDDTEVS
jgi:hypothetical protein